MRWVALMLLAAGCHGTRTEMVVRVAQDGLAIPDDADQLAIFIRDKTTGDEVYEVPPTTLCGSGTCLDLPTAITLFPGSMHPRDLVEVEVQALKSGTVVIDDAAIFTFTDGRDQEIEFVLYHSCLATNCAADPMHRACIGNGICGDAPISPLGGDLSVPPDVDLSVPDDLATPVVPDLSARGDFAVSHDLAVAPDFAVSGDLAGDDVGPAADFSVLHDLSTPVDITVSGPPTVDNAGGGANASTGTLTWAHTIGVAGNRVLIVGVCTNGSTLVQNVTYGGNLMSAMVTSTSGNLELSLWFLASPPVGLNDVLVTLVSGSDAIAGGSVSFFDVNQTPPAAPSTFGNSGTATHDITSAAGDLVLDAVITTGAAAALTASAGQTTRVNIASGASASDCVIGMSTKLGTATTTSTWTFTPPGSWEMAQTNLTP